MPITPRVFISYARDGGEVYAQDLRERLTAIDIPLWQDRVGMEGGSDWWTQIAEALNHVEFLVLVMTPAALRSSTVRREWREARRQGVCVYPVKTDTPPDYRSLPRWMRSSHFYDLTREWPQFVNDLNTRCQVPRVPFMTDDIPADFVQRPRELDQLISALQAPEAGGSLQKYFRARYHITIHGYVDRIRSEEAVRLIIGEGVKVDAAALMVGLRSRKNLYALVKRTTGLELSEIRKTARPTNLNGNGHLNGSERRMQH